MNPRPALTTLRRIRDNSPEIRGLTGDGWSCVSRELSSRELNDYCTEGAMLTLTRGQHTVTVCLYVDDAPLSPYRVRCIISEDVDGEWDADQSAIADVGYDNGLGEQELHVTNLVRDYDQLQDFIRNALVLTA
jgi:hypothetical protein